MLSFDAAQCDADRVAGMNPDEDLEWRFLLARFYR